MRGIRTSLIVLGLTAGLSFFADLASANPVSMARRGIFAKPILVLLINYPINGVMLFLIIRGAAGRVSFTARHDSHFVRDFLGTVLVFSALGALIDTLVFFDDDVTSPPAFIGGIAAIVITCAFVCYRYILTDARLTAVTTVFMSIINVFGWALIGFVWEGMFMHFCIPLDSFLYILFTALMFKSSWKTTASGVRQEWPHFPFGVQPRRRMLGSFRSDVPSVERGKRRGELRVANMTLVVLLAILSAIAALG